MESEEVKQSTPETKDSSLCPDCGGRLFRDYKHAEIVCSKCGLVVDADIADLGAETRSFDSESWLKKQGREAQ